MHTPTPEPSDVIVVGAGIAGLTAAHTLAAAGTRVTVVDQDDRVGGKIQTEPFAGVDLDTAADAFLARVPDAIDLCRELGLTEQLVTPARRGAFLFIDGELHRFPDGLVLGVPTDLDALEASGILSDEGVARARDDLTRAGDPLVEDTTVGALVRDRLGDEAFEVLVEPLLSGVNAGDADRLSVRSGAPQFAAAVHDQPSLIAGLRAQRQAAADPDAPIFYGLRGGTATLTTALGDSVRGHGGDVRLGVGVTRLRRTGDRWSISTSQGEVEARSIVLATPASTTGPLLRAAGADDVLCDEIDALRYASVAMIALAFERDAVRHPLDGTGFLVSRREALTITACSWASSKWAHLGETGRVILRVSVGRSTDERALQLDDAELVAAVVEELQDILDIDADPLAHRVTRWSDALPQFTPGHLDRVASWRATIDANLPSLHLVGAAYDGLGIPACIRQGRAAAQRILDDSRTPAS